METVPNSFPQLFYAYSVIWAILAVYIYSLGRRVTRLEAERREPNTAQGELPKNDR